MKKTFATALLAAAAGFASAAEPALILTGDSVAASTSLTDIDFPDNEATVAVTLNIDYLRTIAGTNFGGSNDISTFILLEGTGSNGASVYKEGICTNGSSNAHTTTFYGVLTRDSATVSNAALSGLPTLFNSTTDWDSIQAISVVFTLSSSSATANAYGVYVNILGTDGEIASYSGVNNAISSNNNKLQEISTLTLDTRLVTSAQLYTSALSAAEAQAVGKSLVPEPATASLSLLALAGLAARRRRK